MQSNYSASDVSIQNWFLRVENLNSKVVIFKLFRLII